MYLNENAAIDVGYQQWERIKINAAWAAMHDFDKGLAKAIVSIRHGSKAYFSHSALYGPLDKSYKDACSLVPVSLYSGDTYAHPPGTHNRRGDGRDRGELQGTRVKVDGEEHVLGEAVSFRPLLPESVDRVTIEQAQAYAMTATGAWRSQPGLSATWDVVDGVTVATYHLEHDRHLCMAHALHRGQVFDFYITGPEAISILRDRSRTAGAVSGLQQEDAREDQLALL